MEYWLTIDNRLSALTLSIEKVIVRHNKDHRSLIWCAIHTIHTNTYNVSDARHKNINVTNACLSVHSRIMQQLR